MNLYRRIGWGYYHEYLVGKGLEEVGHGYIRNISGDVYGDVQSHEIRPSG